jgi:hypothetical protein
MRILREEGSVYGKAATPTDTADRALKSPIVGSVVVRMHVPQYLRNR